MTDALRSLVGLMPQAAGFLAPVPTLGEARGAARVAFDLLALDGKD